MSTQFIRIDPRMPLNDKLAELSTSAKWLYFTVLCYCARNLTDGILTRAQMRAAVQEARVGGRQVDALVDARLVIEREGKWHLPDYLEWNTSRATIEAKRLANASRMRNVRANVHEHVQVNGASARAQSVQGPISRSRSTTSSYPSQRPTAAGTSQGVDNLRMTQLAGQAQRERNERRATGNACPKCNDVGVVEVDPGAFIDCDCKWENDGH